MRSIIFKTATKEYDSFKDFSLVIKECNWKAGALRENRVQIPSRSGSVVYKLTNEPVYDDATLEVKFALIRGLNNDWDGVISAISNAVCGYEISIYKSWMSGWHYVGVPQITDSSTSESTGEITMTITCDPYMLKNTVTTVSGTLTSKEIKTIILKNAYKWVVPTLSVGDSCSIDYTTPLGEKKTFTAEKSKTKYASFILKNGTTSFKISNLTSSSVNYSISYQERKL